LLYAGLFCNANVARLLLKKGANPVAVPFFGILSSSKADVLNFDKEKLIAQSAITNIDDIPIIVEKLLARHKVKKYQINYLQRKNINITKNRLETPL